MPPFETVAAIRRSARRALPRPVWQLVDGGTQAGQTRAANEAAFDRIGLRPRVCRAAWSVDSTGDAFGIQARLPLMLAPLAAQGLAPRAELLQATACARFGVPISVSNFASVPWRDLTATGAHVAAQLYWVDGREQMAARLRLARDSGVHQILLTLDWSFPAGRDWGTPTIPARIGWREVLTWGPAVATKPRWLLSLLANGGLPPLRAPNFDDPTKVAPTFGEMMARWLATDFPTWDDVAWLREQWPGTLVVKGVMNVDDAEKAAAIGVDGIIVSNHGGNDLDTAPASLAALPDVANAVGGRVHVGFDGGIRRGSDIVKALALGATTVLIGRPAAWAVSAAGQQGVSDLLLLLERDVHQTMRALGEHRLDKLNAQEHLRSYT